MDTVYHQNDGDSQLCAREARDSERSAAMMMIFNGLPPVSLEQLGLYVAVRDEKIVAAAWIQRLTDRLAAVWPPTGRNDPVAEAFLANALKPICDASPHQLLRALIPSDAPPRHSKSLETMGLNQVTEIVSLYCPIVPQQTPESSGLEFHNVDVSQERTGTAPFARFAQLTQDTFEDSLDCPELTSVTSALSILNSYTVHACFTPEFWFRIAHSDHSQDVGVLILADNDANEQLELVYLGIRPAFRGLGFGTAAMKYAQRLAAERKRQRITLAVDSHNDPALKLYGKTGFVPYAEHELFMLAKS